MDIYKWLLLFIILIVNDVAVATELLTSAERSTINQLASQYEKACLNGLLSKVDSADLAAESIQKFNKNYCGCIRVEILTGGDATWWRQGTESSVNEFVLRAARDCAAIEIKKIYPDLCEAIFTGLPPGPNGKLTGDNIAKVCGCGLKKLDSFDGEQLKEVVRQTIEEYAAYKRDPSSQSRQPLSLMGAFLDCANQLGQTYSHPANQTQNVIQTESQVPRVQEEKRKGKILDLALLNDLFEQARKLRLQRQELKHIISDFKNRKEAVPLGVLEKRDKIEARIKEIDDREFSRSGRLLLNASQPGEFSSYIAECLNLINRAIRSESGESRRRYLGKTLIVWVDLAASGRIESVVPRAQQMEDKEFGVFLHNIIWKVPRFPEVPQLKARKIEHVSITFSFTFHSAP